MNIICKEYSQIYSNIQIFATLCAEQIQFNGVGYSTLIDCRLKALISLSIGTQITFQANVVCVRSNCNCQCGTNRPPWQGEIEDSIVNREILNQRKDKLSLGERKNAGNYADNLFQINGYQQTVVLSVQYCIKKPIVMKSRQTKQLRLVKSHPVFVSFLADRVCLQYNIALSPSLD